MFPTVGFQIITERGSLEDLPCPGSDKLSIRHEYPALFRWDSKEYFEKFPAKARGLVVRVPLLQHRGEPRGLLLPPFLRARLFETAMLADCEQRPLAVHFLLEPANGFVDRFSPS